MQFRDFTPDDYQTLTDIRNAVYPDEPITVEDLVEQDKKRPANCQMRRWIAEHAGQVIAFGAYGQSPWAYHPQQFFVVVRVHPDFQGQGYGSALYDTVMAALAPFDPTMLEASAREDQPHAMRWLEKRGFKLHIRLQRSILTLAEFDPTPWAGLTEKLNVAGIELQSVAELRASDPDWVRKLYDLNMTLMHGLPGFDNFTPPSLEQWQKDILESNRHNPDTFIVAVHGDQYVGLTELVNNKASDDLFTGLTGVRREYRRRGIATALKARALTWARDHGYPHVHTDNEENNPMLQLNYRLGFRDAPAWMVYRKTEFAPAAD